MMSSYVTSAKSFCSFSALVRKKRRNVTSVLFNQTKKKNVNFVGFSKFRSKDVKTTDGRSNYAGPSRVIGFTIGASGIIYIGSCIVHYERHRTKSDGVFRYNWTPNFPSTDKYGSWRTELSNMWNQLTVGGKVICGMVCANVLVSLGWRLSQDAVWMIRLFTISAKICHPRISQILCAFSHRSIFHLLVNMYVISTFGANLIDHYLGPEQFLGLFLSAATFSSCISILHKYVITHSGLSLGASGAIMALLIYTCYHMQDKRCLSIIFLPQYTFTGEQAIKGILLLESMCLILRFRVFDHAAHLGGCLFGLWYAHYGQSLLWNRWRFKVVRKWMDITGR